MADPTTRAKAWQTLQLNDPWMLLEPGPLQRHGKEIAPGDWLSWLPEPSIDQPPLLLLVRTVHQLKDGRYAYECSYGGTE